MTRVIVVGGGIVGLTAGLAMRNVGFEVLVCEQHPEIRGTGASLMLWANALGALNRYRVFDAIKQNSDPLNQGLYYDPKGILL
ncbi:MAG: FAD-dependent oxidoreductase, partial [Candidatus Dormibacteraceae bacterium]